MSGLRISTACGADIAPHLPDIAALRIEVFRAFPYLYEGTIAYESRYLRTYIESAESVFLLVHADEQLIGASSGLPLEDETAEVRAPFEQAGMAFERVFYCGESVLLPSYRGQGLGHRFFDAREAHARALGRFDTIAFCAVQRPFDHPRRPSGYRPLDEFWSRRGYRQSPTLNAQMSWRDLDETVESPKTMIFWTRTL